MLIVKPILRRHDYILIFLEAGKTREEHFTASHWAALSRVKTKLGISGRLTVKRFLAAGGVKLLLGSQQIFPRTQGSHQGGGK